MNISPEKFIPACNRLYSFSSSKRLELLNNEFKSEDDIGRIALEINKDISSEHGLDIFLIDKRIEILKFEDILTDKVAQFSFDNFLSEDDIKEEELLKKNAISISNDYIQQFEIQSSVYINDLKSIFKLTSDEIKHILYHPSSAVLLDAESQKNELKDFFLVSESKIRSKKKIIFFHVGFIGVLEKESGAVNVKRKSGITLPETEGIRLYSGKKTGEQKLELKTMLVFDYKKNEQFRDNPIKLFLSILDFYGVKFNFNSKEKAYFYEVSLPRSMEREMLESPSTFFNTDVPRGDMFYPHFKLNVTKTELLFRHVYAINKVEYLKDYRSLNV
jgi:hypothetical protein